LFGDVEKKWDISHPLAAPEPVAAARVAVSPWWSSPMLGAPGAAWSWDQEI